MSLDRYIDLVYWSKFYHKKAKSRDTYEWREKEGENAAWTEVTARIAYDTQIIKNEIAEQNKQKG